MPKHRAQLCDMLKKIAEMAAATRMLIPANSAHENKRDAELLGKVENRLVDVELAIVRFLK